MVTLIATLRAFWDTGNIRVRFVILAFLGWVFGSATFYTTLSMQGFQGIIPYFAASQVILSAVFVARFAKWTTTGQPRGEPIIGLAIFLTGRTRYLVWGIPLLEAIYCMLPFHLHPKWTIMVLTSVLGMIVFTSAHQSGWPWASRMRTICIYFLFLTFQSLGSTSLPWLGAVPTTLGQYAKTSSTRTTKSRVSSGAKPGEKTTKRSVTPRLMSGTSSTPPILRR